MQNESSSVYGGRPQGPTSSEDAAPTGLWIYYNLDSTRIPRLTALDKSSGNPGVKVKGF
jgi:hypothetical protein